MFVANGSTTPITSASTYAGVLYRDTVRVAFTYSDGLDIMEADIQNSGIHNAHLQDPIS